MRRTPNLNLVDRKLNKNDIGVGRPFGMPTITCWCPCGLLLFNVIIDACMPDQRDMRRLRRIGEREITCPFNVGDFACSTTRAEAQCPVRFQRTRPHSARLRDTGGVDGDREGCLDAANSLPCGIEDLVDLHILLRALSLLLALFVTDTVAVARL